MNCKVLNPVVSIVTVCYNAVKTIEETIKSVISQDYQNIEYIIVDGGSKDGTLEVIKKYEKKITRWISEPDKGIYDAMNKGIIMASGEWILFRNSGDLFYDEQSVSKVFSNAIDHSIDILHGDCQLRDGKWYKNIKPDIELDEYNGFSMPVLHPSTFVRTCIHKSRLFSLDYRSSSDFDFFLHLIKENKKFLYVPELLSIMDASCGMSVDNISLVYNENYRILSDVYKWNLRIKIIKKILVRISVLNQDFHNLWKNILPLNIVNRRKDSNKIKQGWKTLVDK